MTDLPAPYPPTSQIAQFGVSIVGPKFRWAYIERVADSDETEVRVRVFRAHPGLSFEEQLAYQRSLTLLQASAVIEQRTLEKVIEAIAEIPDDNPDEDHPADWVSADDRRQDALNALADGTAVSERERWAIQLDQVLTLVAAVDRAEFRPLLEEANPADVRALKEHLVQLVINRVPAVVEAAAQVDPTSPPSSSG